LVVCCFVTRWWVGCLLVVGWYLVGGWLLVCIVLFDCFIVDDIGRVDEGIYDDVLWMRIFFNSRKQPTHMLSISISLL
jgi:hypothetical protein